jgi:hypothetical protein
MTVKGLRTKTRQPGWLNGMLEGGYFTFTLGLDTHYKIMDKEMIREYVEGVGICSGEECAGGDDAEDEILDRGCAVN